MCCFTHCFCALNLQEQEVIKEFVTKSCAFGIDNKIHHRYFTFRENMRQLSSLADWRQIVAG